MAIIHNNYYHNNHYIQYDYISQYKTYFRIIIKHKPYTKQVGVKGLEPLLTESKSAVLPLHYTPVLSSII